MAQAPPDFAIGLINFEHGLQVIDRSWEVLLDSQNVGDGIERLDGLIVVSQCLLIRIQGLLRIALQFVGTPYFHVSRQISASMSTPGQRGCRRPIPQEMRAVAM